MTKKHLFYNEAERFFVYEMMSVEEIASRLQLGSRTVRNWKDDNGWDAKKKQYIASKLAFHEELYEFAKKLMRSIDQDLESGQKVDPARMFAFTRMLPSIIKVKEYEDVAKKKDQKQDSKGLTEDIIKLIEEEVLGITDRVGLHG